MKNASEIMYKVGKIINIILIPLSALMLIIGFIALGVAGMGAATGEGEIAPAVASLAASSGFLIGYGIVLLVVSIVSLIICSKKHANIATGSNEVSDRVFLIVFGVVGDNIFYILAGIFSLVARSQEANTPANKEE